MAQKQKTNFLKHLFWTHIAPIIVFLFYRCLLFTWRIRWKESPEMLESFANKKPVVMAMWHGDELALIHCGLRYPLCTLTSTSKDGEIMNRVLNYLKVQTSRGSSTRGAVQALKGVFRIVKSTNRGCVFAVDGPKGPYHKIKPGVFELARLLKLPIYVSGVAVDRAWHFPKAWNKTFLPKPFAKVSICWHGPFHLPEPKADPRSPELAAELEKFFDVAAQEAAANL